MGSEGTGGEWGGVTQKKIETNKLIKNPQNKQKQTGICVHTNEK